MFYSEDIIEQVRSENNIVDVIGDYVKLQKKGSSYFGLCPFHNEKSPSFSVSPHKQMYYCFDNRDKYRSSQVLSLFVTFRQRKNSISLFKRQRVIR